MNDFLTKPVSPQDLAAALRRLFGQDAADARSLHRRRCSRPPQAPDMGLIDDNAVEAALLGIAAERLGR